MRAIDEGKRRVTLSSMSDVTYNESTSELLRNGKVHLLLLSLVRKITLNNTVLRGGALCDITKGQGVQQLCTGTFDLPEISSCYWLGYFKMSNKTHCEEIQQQTPMPSPQRCTVTSFLTCKRLINTLICWWILMKTKHEKLGMIWDL